MTLMVTSGTYAAHERRDERDACLSARNSLTKAKEQGQVAVNPVITLELARSLDTLPGGRDLDQDALLLDPDRLVERDELLGLSLGAFLVEREAGINLGGDATGDDGEDLLSEFYELDYGWAGQPW